MSVQTVLTDEQRAALTIRGGMIYQVDMVFHVAYYDYNSDRWVIIQGSDLDEAVHSELRFHHEGLFVEAMESIAPLWMWEE